MHTIRKAKVKILLLACGTYLPTYAASIFENPPFLPPDFEVPSEFAKSNSQKEGTNTQRLEFKGVYLLGTEYYFNIFDKQANNGQWINKKDSNELYQILNYNAALDTLSLKWEGEIITLTLSGIPRNATPLLQRPVSQPVAPPLTRIPLRRK